MKLDIEEIYHLIDLLRLDNKRINNILTRKTILSEKYKQKQIDYNNVLISKLNEMLEGLKND